MDGFELVFKEEKDIVKLKNSKAFLYEVITEIVKGENTVSNDRCRKCRGLIRPKKFLLRSFNYICSLILH